jgi:SAM-dependent methyltransferase
MQLLKRALEKADRAQLTARYRMRGAKGSWWDEKGPRQVEFLKSEGLLPYHYLLDVGCGPLRGGIPIIAYLDKGHYYGIEKEISLIRAGLEVELPRHRLVGKEPHVEQIADFDVSGMGKHFDYMIAFSVFNHLVDRQVELALKNLIPHLKPGGAFYADYNEADVHSFTKIHPWRPGEVRKSFFPFSFFTNLGQRYGFVTEGIEGWADVLKDRKCVKFSRRV